MAYGNRLTRGRALVGTLDAGNLSVGGGSAIAAIKTGTVGVDPPNVLTLSTGTANVLLAGVAVGDFVILMPEQLNNGVVYAGAQVIGAGTVAAYFVNTTAGSINPASADWQYLHIDLTP